MKQSNNTLNFLLIGDVVAKIGRRTIAQVLPKLKKQLKLDLVVANGENLAHGSGITEQTITELYDSGVDFITTGDHVFKNYSNIEQIFSNKKYNIIRPANYPPGVIGDGYKIIKIGEYKICIINLQGRVFMKTDLDCPFRKFDEIYKKIKKIGVNFIIVDFHAEASSEKRGLFYYIKDRVNIFYGTHTHIGTADLEIYKNTTVYITDVGMVGDKNSSLGVDFKNVIESFLYQIPTKHEFNDFGDFIFNSLLVKYDFEKSTISAKRIDKFGTIK